MQFDRTHIYVVVAEVLLLPATFEQAPEAKDGKGWKGRTAPRKKVVPSAWPVSVQRLEVAAGQQR